MKAVMKRKENFVFFCLSARLKLSLPIKVAWKSGVFMKKVPWKSGASG